MKKSATPLTRRTMLGSSAAAALASVPLAQSLAQAPAATPAAAPVPDSNWLSNANGLSAQRYAPFDEINASNFNRLEEAWRFDTRNYGNHADSYFNATPILANGRMYCTVGLNRDLVCLDPATGELLWAYRHDEKGRMGARQGSGWGCAYWTDGKEERILYCTISYQLVSIDARTGKPDPKFGDGSEVDLRNDWDHVVDPKARVVGIHAPPLIVRDVAIVGNASASTGPGHLRAYDVRTGKRKWIFHTVPQKGEFGYDTWQAGQAEGATNTGVWAMMSADPELGLVYAGVELPQADTVGVTRIGDALFSESLVALDIETGKRKWHFQTEHHGLWDRDIPAPATLFDLSIDGRMVKALALPTKQAFLFVLDRTNGKPVWPINEIKVEAGDVPGEFYSPVQPVPSKPPAFDRQGFSMDFGIDWTPELKARSQAIISHYHIGPTTYTPPMVRKPAEGMFGTLNLPESQGGANWPGGSYDPDNGIFYVYSKTNTAPTSRGTNDNMGGGFGGTANPGGVTGRIGGPVEPGTRDGLTDPIVPGLLTINGMSILKPPYGRITAIDLKNGTQLWQIAHGETPDFIKNNPLMRGIAIPRTGQSGILGVLTTRSLVICGDSGGFTDEQGRKAARLRAYDKMTGKEVGAVFLQGPQTGSPMTYMLNGHQHIVVAIGGFEGAQLLCLRLPQPRPAAAGGRGGRGGGGGAPAGRGGNGDD